jgi:GMP synthase (glutamine-hydrolyzing) (EC 6.3.5.2)
MNTVVILDFGSQYTQLIARRVRELGVYSEILPYNAPLEKILALQPKALIFSGGPASVYAKSAPMPDARLYTLNLPILGICYGLQVIAKHFGGKVELAKAREYGRANLIIKQNGKANLLFKHVPNSTVWMSHADKVTVLPAGFEVIAESDNSELCAVAYCNDGKQIFGLQFHPEVHHTVYGKQILANFLFEIAHLSPDWSPQNFIESQIEKIRQTVGKERVICALSGGVDSTVAATLVSRAIGKRLKCVFVDNGLLRKNEAKEVKAALSSLGLNLKVVHAAHLFLSRLERVIDPEKKRKIIGKTFIEVFEANISREKFLVQVRSIQMSLKVLMSEVLHRLSRPITTLGDCPRT